MVAKGLKNPLCKKMFFYESFKEKKKKKAEWNKLQGGT